MPTPTTGDGARTLIVGGGAIGGVTAARLARAGQRVTVLDANPEHVRRMKDPGLIYDELGATSTVRIDAVDSPEQLDGTYDFALTMLKAPYLEAAVTGLLDHARVDAYVSFGNGLIQDRLEALVGAPRMLIGIVEWGATNLGPGQVAQTTVAPFVVGEIDGSRSERVERLRQVLSCAGDARISDNMFGQVWSKLLLNSTFSGLGAISGLVYADVVASPSGTELAFALWAEGHATARANGVMLDEVAGVHPDQLLITDSTADASAALAQLMSRLGPTKASMLQDLERGARTEVDVINGGVVQAAQRAGLAAPLNARIAEMVHECEAGSRTPDPANLDDLAGMLD